VERITEDPLDLNIPPVTLGVLVEGGAESRS
jgi:hypothetical protein